MQLILARIFKRLKIKTGLHISFVGIDGSGKSTLINQFYKKKIIFFLKIYILFIFINPYLITHQQLKKNLIQKKNYGFFFYLFSKFYFYTLIFFTHFIF